jgi:type I restriction enzyme S subunit
MSDWEETTLGEACAIEIGGTPSRSEESYWWKSAKDGQALPWVSISDMRERVVSETKESITEIGARNSNCKHVTKGTLLMSFKLTIGRLAFAGKDLYTNEAIAAIRPREGINPEFLYYGLQYWNLTDGTDQAVKGVTLNKQKLQEIRCSIPPLPEQKKIAEILYGIDNDIESTRMALTRYEIANNASVFNQVSALASDQENLRPVEEISSKITDGEHQTPPRTSSGVLLLSARNIRNGFISVSDVDYISEETHERLSRRISARTDDLLISCSGSVGRCCLVPGDMRFSMVRSVALVRPEQSAIRPAYLLAAFSSEFVQRQIQSSLSQLAQANLFQGAIKKIVIPVPHHGEQEKIGKLFSAGKEQCRRLHQKIQKLELLKQALSADLFSGRKRVSV